MPNRDRLIAEITQALAAAEAPDEFRVLQNLCRLYAFEGDSPDFRNLLIQSIDPEQRFDNIQSGLSALVREVGLFPYLGQRSVDSREEIALRFHVCKDLSDEFFLHRAQYQVLQRLLSGKDVVLSAPTSFGKSVLIDATIARRLPDTVVIIVPTIALIDETRRRLQQRFAPLYKIVTHSAQTRGDKTIFVLTQERVVERSDIDNVDLLVLDEFYKLSPERDDTRSQTLNVALLRLMPKARQLYMLGPSIESLNPDVPERIRNAFVSLHDAMVANRVFRIDPKEDSILAVRDALPRIERPLAIFTSSPGRAAKMAAGIETALPKSERTAAKNLAAWLARNFHPEWHVVSCLKRGIGIHHGRIPRAVAAMIVDLYNNKELDVLVCTSTLIEGVNTVTKSIIVADGEINREPIDYFTFNNIKGRTGRLMFHFVGHVYLLQDPPAGPSRDVDIPAFTQSSNMGDSLLFEIDDAELTDNSKQRRTEALAGGVLSPATLRANLGVRLEDQLKVVEFLRGDLVNARKLLRWSRIPTYKELLYACEIIWQQMGGSRLGRGSVRSASQLAVLIQKLAGRPTVRELIEGALKYNGNDADAATGAVLDFLRYWAEFHYPHLITCLQRIANDVFARRNIPPVDFTVHAALVQRLFRDVAVTALEEYGLPMQVTIKILAGIRSSDDLDGALAKLKRLNIDSYSLTPTERRFVSRAKHGI
jgi:hypothetical protein